MAIIEKKIWPEFFVKVKLGQKNVEWRLADFKARKGDTLVLREWNPRTKKYSGRVTRRKIYAIHKANPFKFHSLKELKKYGVYLIEMK